MRRAAWVLLLTFPAIVQGCGRSDTLSPCNIATKACQEDVFYSDLRLRGAAFDPFGGVPPITTVTLAEFRQQLLDAQKSASASTPKDSGKPKIDPWDVAFGLLGLIKPSTSTAAAAVQDQVSNVAAFYSSTTRSVTVIDRGGDRNDYGDTKLLSHELVHAFQDQDNEFEGFGNNRTTDSGFAARALTEGEATLYEQLAGAEMDEIEPKTLDWDGYYGGWVKSLRNRLPQQESTYYAVNWFVYPLGAGMLTRAWLDGGPAGVRHVIAAFPNRTLDFLASRDGFTASARIELQCSVKPLGKGFKRVGLDRFGALQFYAFLVAAGVSEQDAWSYAEDWRDDSLWLYFDEARADVVVYWRHRLGSSAAAEAVVDAIPPSTARALDAIDRDVLIRASNVPSLVADGQGAVDCEP